MKQKRGPADPKASPDSRPSVGAAPAPDTVSPGSAERSFPIVGIGASAGGLAAFESFLSAIPPDSEPGMAFVLVQHLSPDHKSLLTELCQRCTRLPVHEVADDMEVQPGCIYIIPPSSDMALLNGRLHLLPPIAPRGLRLPIDFFFRSLAQDLGRRAVGVVLSGTGSDGTLGARAIKGAGGTVLVQTPESAAFDGMPRSVIDAGLADFILSPDEMPAQLLAYAAHAFGRLSHPADEAPIAPEAALKRICVLLRSHTRHDFSQYKSSTLLRRIERRMALHQIAHEGDYVRYLQSDPAELDALFRDLLIGVTSFFRDPEAFALLQSQAIPRLFADKRAGAPVRVWVCGCSTGEEAYSIAILLQEHQETLKQSYKIQVFATDIDPRAIGQARAGVYPASIAADVSAERLARFFSQDAEGGDYRIRKIIRDLAIFSEQDLIRDPPFSRMDLIACRNLLIYMDGAVQKRLIPLFHYALNPGGILFLGTSETVGDAPTLFSTLSRKWKLYVSQEPRTFTAAVTALSPPTPIAAARPPGPALDRDARQASAPDLGALTDRILLRHYASVAVLVDARGDILHIRGRTGYYLEPTPGDAAMNILAMAREGLRRELTVALHRAVARREVVRFPGLRIRTNGDFSVADLTVRPAEGSEGDESLADLYLAILEPSAHAESAATPPGAPTACAEAAECPGAAARVAELELELKTKEEYLQTTLEEMETANEELKSAIEEMQSVNEELQSTNEELETSKEELQSVNEELATVNAELQTKVTDLSRANNDMNNLLAGTGVGTLFVDHGLRITRFTPAATQLIKLIQTDLGRHVGDIVVNLVGYNALAEDVQEVLRTLVPQEREVQTRQGAWYLMRIGPYRTLENVIEGAVITFVDITKRKQTEDALRQARVFFEGIVETAREALVVLDGDLRVISANRAFYRHFRVARAETEGQPFGTLGNGQWNAAPLLELLAQIRSEGVAVEDFQLTHVFPEIGQRTIALNARCLDLGPDADRAILIAMEDRTERIGGAGDGESPHPRSGPAVPPPSGGSA